MASGDTPARKKRRQTVARTVVRTERFRENGGDATFEVPQELCDFYNDREDLSESFDVILHATGSMQSQPGRFPILHNVFGLAKTMFDECVDWASKQIGIGTDKANNTENEQSGLNGNHSSASADVSSLPSELLPRISVQQLPSTAENSALSMPKNYEAKKCNLPKLCTNGVSKIKKERSTISLVRSPLSTNVSFLKREPLLQVSVQRLPSLTPENPASNVSKNSAKKCNSQKFSTSNVTKIKKEPCTTKFLESEEFFAKISSLMRELPPQVSAQRLSSPAKNSASRASNSNSTGKCKSKFSPKKVLKVKYPDRKALETAEPVAKKIRLHSKSKSLIVNCRQRVNLNMSQNSLSAQSKFGWCCGGNGDPPFVYAGLSPRVHLSRLSRIYRSQV